MKPWLSRSATVSARFSTCAALVVAGLLGTPTSHAATQDLRAEPLAGARPTLASLESVRRARVHYDALDDGTVWAVGADSKVAFSARGAEYFPGFGPSQPSDESLPLSPDSVTLAGHALGFDRDATARRDGDHVEYERLSFRERYDLRPTSMEQSFEFTRLPERGELVVRIPVPTGASVSTDADGIRFLWERGEVRYGRAVAIDARGARSDVATDYVDGSIVLQVDGAFVSAATLPLVIDPTVVTIPIEASSVDASAADGVWESVGNVWFVVHQQAFSATDSDVWGYTFDASGAVVGSTIVESGSGSWTTPRCATLPASHVFLVVAEVSTVVPKAVVVRRVTQNFGLITTDPTISNVAGTTLGDLTGPDVGGDPYPGAPAYFCVVFTHTLTGLEREIGYRMVSPAGTLVGTGPTFFAHPAGTRESAVSISSNNDASSWTVAWQRADALQSSLSGIWAARLDWNGALAAAPFLVVDSGLVERAPSVSSLQRGTLRTLIAYRQSSSTSGQGDVGVAALDGTSVVATFNLTALENAGTQSQDQQNPTVETDGERFFVAYPEVNGAGQADLHGSQMLWTGATPFVYEAHALLQHAVGSVARPRLAGKIGTTSTDRFLCGYDVEVTATNHDVACILFDGVVPGSNSLFCFGDSTGVGCPCGNTGATTHGCAHSASAIGAWLLKTGGTASVSQDDAQLQIGNVPAGAPCLFFQGTTQLAGTPFGDGLLCVGGSITRLAVTTATGTLASCPLGIAFRGGVPATGGLRAYQVWYRDGGPSFCTASTFNLSNGLALQWAP